VLDRRHTLPRLIAAWAAIAAAALSAAVFLVIANLDPLEAALTAFAFAAATFFPVLLLAIWWGRCTGRGAFAAISSGFAVMVLEVSMGSAFGVGHMGLTTPLASLIGALVALGAGLAVSLVWPQGSKAEQSYREEMRDPGGDAIYDRAQRAVAAAASVAVAGATGE
jgi:cation/acetate symporter